MTGVQDLPDPRPVVQTVGGEHRLRGWACTSCGHPVVLPGPCCPRCQGPLGERLFGPAGTVWSATVVRVGLPGHSPPYALAYVDFDDGPRVLTEVDGDDAPLRAGTRVRLVAGTHSHDVRVSQEGEGS